MKQYVAVVSHDAGVITKYQDFDTQTEADTHVAEYGGKVVEGVTWPFEYWDVSGDAPVRDDATANSDAVIHEARVAIRRLEGEVTQRRMREAALGTDGGWLANQESLIAAERAKL